MRRRVAPALTERRALPGLASLLPLVSLVPLALAWKRGQAARSLERWQHPPQPSDWPSLSVIIPAWNEQGTLIRCLDALIREEFAGQCELIVVAGGPDGTLDAARAYAASSPHDILVLPQRKDGGKNGAMNDAAFRAGGAVLVFIDADTVITPGWLAALVAPLEAGYAAVTGKFAPVRRTAVTRALELSQVLEYEARGRVQLQGSGGMAVRRDAYRALGGLPEDGPFADDWDLTQRLLAAGYRLAFAPAALSYTERPATLAEWWKNELRWRRIHLLSLFRVRKTELSDPLKAARALYPYITAWAALGSTAAAVVTLAAPRRSGRTAALRSVVQTLWLLTVAPLLGREIGGAVETAAFTGQLHWLTTAAVLPVLTVMGWAAAAVASLTSGRAQLHYKGPRTLAPPVQPGESARPDDAYVETLLLGGVS